MPALFVASLTPCKYPPYPKKNIALCCFAQSTIAGCGSCCGWGRPSSTAATACPWAGTTVAVMGCCCSSPSSEAGGM